MIPARIAAQHVDASRPREEIMPMPVIDRACEAMGYSALSQRRQTGLSSFGMAMTGPCTTGNGGVFLSLCNIRSIARVTFLPSNITSKEKLTNSALPLTLLDATPKRLPASSPVLVWKLESFTQVGLPSHST